MSFQGKRNQQYKDSARFTWYGFLGALLISILLTLCGCYGTYYISDAEYSDAREEHASITYYDNQIYWGWHSGYYYYYGKPHYYPWYYYYNACPPSHYNTTTHVIITRPVNKPTHRPTINRPRGNDNTRIYVKPNKNHNRTNTKVNIKTNRNNKVTNKRRPK